ncbi:MAG: hypothetical protein AAGC74_05480 [Verrucomicrobiota bacterium]
MKIAYKVLWFEDRPEKVGNDVFRLKRYLESLGFRLDVDFKESISFEEVAELGKRLQDYCSYDLILCDFDMGEGPAGHEIAGKLRETIRAEMAFYSGKETSELREILYQQGVDAVYPVNRTELYDELRLIIEDHIQKVCDMNNMRGMVIDEICKLERRMRAILVSRSSNLDDENKENILAQIGRKAVARGESTKERVLAKSCPSQVFGDYRLSEFNLIRIKLREFIDGEDMRGALGESGLLKKLQDLRNRMAHSEAEYDEERGVMVFNDSRGSDEFGYEKFAEIRRELIEAATLLENQA